MRILITGAHGYIGKTLSEFLQKERPDFQLFLPMSKELDLLNASSVDTFFENNKIDCIIHAANKGGTRGSHTAVNIVNDNLRMFCNIIKYHSRVDKIIHFGSGAEYGKHKDIVDVDEEATWEELPQDDYGFYKSVCSRYIEEINSNVVNLRIFGCFGLYEDYRYRFISNAIVKNLFKLPIVINQNVFFDYIYDQDLAKIVLFFIENQWSNPVYNLTSGNKIDLISLAHIINNQSQFKSEIVVKSSGLNYEYTASNKRLLTKIGEFNFTPYENSIKEMIFYFSGKLKDIQCEEIKEDAFIHLCKRKDANSI